MKTDVSGNLAVGKPTSMLELGSSSISCYPWKGADGRRDNHFTKDQNCAHGSNRKGNWWKVDLQAVYLIKEVDITTRGDAYGESECIAAFIKFDCKIFCIKCCIEDTVMLMVGEDDITINIIIISILALE